MIRTNHISHKTDRSIFWKKHASKLMLLFFFLIAYALGCFFCAGLQNESNSFLRQICSGFVQTRTESGFLNIGMHIFLNSVLLLSLLYISGFLPVSLPICLGILLFKGMGLGMTAGYLFYSNRWFGLLYFIAILMPSALILLWTLICGGIYAKKMSSEIRNNFKAGENAVNLNKKLKLFSLRYLIFAIIILIASFIESILTILFAGYFPLVF